MTPRVTTRYYRSPEIIRGECSNGPAADIYSAGIVLFTLMSKGVIPHTENVKFRGIDFFNLLNNDNSEFWRKHCEVRKKPSSEFSKSFRDLFNGMTKLNPEERFTIKDIKESEWYNEEILTTEELNQWYGEFYKQ